jgi:hypothetical protein
MAVIQSYRTCDICGKRLLRGSDKWNYHIEPPSKIQIGIWKYLFSDPYDVFWSNSLDICDKCWEEMRSEIRKRVKDNGT